MINKLYLRSYMMFKKWSSFATPKTELLLSISLLLYTSLRVLVVLQITCNYMNDLLNTHELIKAVL